MLWGMTSLTQLDEVNPTHDDIWKYSRVGLYRQSESTRDVDRRAGYIRYLKIPGLHKTHVFHLTRDCAVPTAVQRTYTGFSMNMLKCHTIMDIGLSMPH